MLALNWIAPSPLNIPMLDSDITYYVDVVNSTNLVVLDSVRGITETEFTYSSPETNIGCGIITFTVTPVNLVGPGRANSVPFQPVQGKGTANLYFTLKLVHFCAGVHSSDDIDC